jgi:hypothetical protein
LFGAGRTGCALGAAEKRIEGKALFTAAQFIAHGVGDYILQSQWMADNKTKHSTAALAHVATYILPFLLLTHSPLALVVIGGTHFLIDRFRLARYLCWLKNGPLMRWHGGLVWKRMTATGYQDAVPAWMAVWLFIICDNLCHILLNGLALAYIR